jgi:uncharacterized membrane protein
MLLRGCWEPLSDASTVVSIRIRQRRPIEQQMSWYDLTATIAVISSGLIAGQMLAIALSNHADKGQPASEWVRRFQLENRLFTRTMPPALLVPLLTLTGCAFVAANEERAGYGIAAIGMFAVLIITMMANVPINRAIATWSATEPPSAWAATRDRWLAWHWSRTILGIVSFYVSAGALHGV